MIIKAWEPEVIPVQPMPFTANYAWSVGALMEKFIKSLAHKKLLASKCPACGYTYVPPRNRCGKCAAKMDESNLVELSGKGSVLSFTEAFVTLDGAGDFLDLDEPVTICAVKLEGADSTLFLPLVEGEDDGPFGGMEVEIVWSGENAGQISDISGVKPI